MLQIKLKPLFTTTLNPNFPPSLKSNSFPDFF